MNDAGTSSFYETEIICFETRLLGGDRDLVAEVITEASGCVRVKGVCAVGRPR